MLHDAHYFLKLLCTTSSHGSALLNHCISFLSLPSEQSKVEVDGKHAADEQLHGERSAKWAYDKVGRSCVQEEVLRVAQEQHAGLGSSDAGGADAARGSKENLHKHQVRGLLDAVLAA